MAFYGLTMICSFSCNTLNVNIGFLAAVVSSSFLTIAENAASRTISGFSRASLARLCITFYKFVEGLLAFSFGRLDHHRFMDQQREVDCGGMESVIEKTLGNIEVHTQKDLDEAAVSYKDIDVVMWVQKDLVRIRIKLSPIAVVKG